MKKGTISFFLMASNGMKFIYLKKQQSTLNKSLYSSNFDNMFLLEHEKKTATKSCKKKKKVFGRQQAALQKHLE